jgi:hypothetical protein
VSVICAKGLNIGDHFPNRLLSIHWVRIRCARSTGRLAKASRSKASSLNRCLIRMRFVQFAKCLYLFQSKMQRAIYRKLSSACDEKENEDCTAVWASDRCCKTAPKLWRRLRTIATSAAFSCFSRVNSSSLFADAVGEAWELLGPAPAMHSSFSKLS